MRQRVMIAMAIALNPALLIADEPTTALDVTVQAQNLDLLGQLQKEFDMAVVIITHDLGVIAEVADCVLVMYAGKEVEHADVIALFRQPHHPYTRRLIESLPEQAQETNGYGRSQASPRAWSKSLRGARSTPVANMSWTSAEFGSHRSRVCRRGRALLSLLVAPRIGRV